MQPQLVQPEVAQTVRGCLTESPGMRKFEVSASQAFGMLLDNYPKVLNHREQLCAYDIPANPGGRGQ